MSHCNTDNLNYFWIFEPLARCAKRGSSLPLGTPMEINCTSAYLHYPLPQCSKIVTPIIFSISYELFRLPSAKNPKDYQLLRTFVWCLMEKLTRNNELFLDTFQLSSRRLRKVSMSFLKKHSTLYGRYKVFLLGAYTSMNTPLYNPQDELLAIFWEPWHHQKLFVCFVFQRSLVTNHQDVLHTYSVMINQFIRAKYKMIHTYSIFL